MKRRRRIGSFRRGAIIVWPSSRKRKAAGWKRIVGLAFNERPKEEDGDIYE